MTLEERAEFEATERDAALWRYLQSEDFRSRGSDDPDIVLFDRKSGAQIPVEVARQKIEKFLGVAITV